MFKDRIKRGKSFFYFFGAAALQTVLAHIHKSS